MTRWKSQPSNSKLSHVNRSDLDPRLVGKLHPPWTDRCEDLERDAAHESVIDGITATQRRHCRTSRQDSRRRSNIPFRTTPLSSVPEGGRRLHPPPAIGQRRTRAGSTRPCHRHDEVVAETFHLGERIQSSSAARATATRSSIASSRVPSGCGDPSETRFAVALPAKVSDRTFDHLRPRPATFDPGINWR